MSILIGLLVIGASGALGGVASALMSGEKVAPSPEKDAQGHIVAVRPGVIGNVFLGALAATISWCLYGPAAGWELLGSAQPVAGGPGWAVTLAALAGAALVGTSGARWLTNEIDKKLLRLAGAEAAASGPNPRLARFFSTSLPSTVLHAATKTEHSKDRV